MKIVVRANWDDDAKVWYAVADHGVGLCIEGETTEILQEKIPVFSRTCSKENSRDHSKWT